MKLHCDIKTEWECIDKENKVFAPRTIENVQLNMSKKSKHSQEMEIETVWIVGKARDDLFTLVATDSLRTNEGPLSDERKKLVEKRAETKRPEPK